MTPNTQRLQDKLAIIIGGASSIGEASARLFSSHGPTVIIADIQDALGLSVAASIVETNTDRFHYVHCDVRDELQISFAVNFVVQTYGHLDIMFTNAGIIGSLTDILDLDMNSFNDLMVVRIRGAAAVDMNSFNDLPASTKPNSAASSASSSPPPPPPYLLPSAFLCSSCLTQSAAIANSSTIDSGFHEQWVP